MTTPAAGPGAPGAGPPPGRPGDPGGADAPSQAPPAAPAPPVRVLGVRHHGPGSARALAAALEDYRPDCVLVEGPADADDLLTWVGAPGMEPPVALLAWKADEPSVASFWPLAVFSPEWQALRWAAEHGVEAHFMDLPARHVLAEQADNGKKKDGEGPGPADADAGSGGDESAGSAASGPADDAGPDGAPGAGGGESGSDGAEPAVGESPGPAADEDPGSDDAPDSPPRTDPIAELARLAGYADPEAWWEDAVELRLDGDPFDPLAEAIGLLRETAPETDERTLRREAHMRKVLRAARRRGHERIAVVCGAWHAPALRGRLPAAKADNALLTRSEEHTS